MWTVSSEWHLTPDATGIIYYDENFFLNVLRTGQVNGQPLNPIMPVMVYRDLIDSDLKSMFDYLHTLKPIKHKVDNSQPPTACKLCQQRHGGGDKN